MQRILVSGAIAAAILFGPVTGIGTAAPGTGLPLEPLTGDSVPRPVLSSGDTTGSAYGQGSSGSALTGPVDSGSSSPIIPLYSTLSGAGAPCRPITLCLLPRTL
ncbi:hypothetical protein [Nocardia sp. X0981]